MAQPRVTGARSWFGAFAVASGVLVALTAAGGPAAAAQSGAGTTTTTSRVNAGDDPCALLSAAEVEAALGIVDPDGPGPYGEMTNRCIYGEPLGLHFRIINDFTTVGGKDAKETCGRAADGVTLYADYARVRGVGKFACSYTFNADPTLLVVALRRGSRTTGRELTLTVSGTADELAPLQAKIDSGLPTLARQAARFVKQENDR